MNEKLKMKNIVEELDIPKSTVLYYIKEGVFDKPEIIGKNIHLYNKSEIKIKIHIIELLKNELNSSIEILKESVGKLEIKETPIEILKSITDCIERLAVSEEFYSRNDFIEIIGSNKFLFFIEKDYLTDKGFYSKRDLLFAQSLLNIFKFNDEGEILFYKSTEKMINNYIKGYDSISEYEKEFLIDIKDELISDFKDGGFSKGKVEDIYIDIFNIVLSIKPFIQNKSTLKVIRGF